MARTLSWVTLGWLGIEAGVAIGATIVARSVALLGFGLDNGIESLASRLEPALGLANRRLGRRLGSLATAGEGTQNLLCAYLVAAGLAGPASA